MPGPTDTPTLPLDLTEATIIEMRTQALTAKSHATELLKASEASLKNIERLLARKQAAG